MNLAKGHAIVACCKGGTRNRFYLFCSMCMAASLEEMQGLQDVEASPDLQGDFQKKGEEKEGEKVSKKYKFWHD